MFKMAKKIFDGGSKNAAAAAEPMASGALDSSDPTGKPQRSGSKESSSKKAQKDQLGSEPVPPHKSINRPPMSTEELNDFSKLEDDPRLPLSVRQIFKITKSWKAIARATSKTGTVMFLNLFEQNKDLFYLFDRFQHLKGKELHESMELREHAATVMSTLDQSINLLSDYDNFVAYLHSIGKLHRKVPDFKREHFWKIEQPFLTAVKQTLDERCNETIEQIYKIAIKLIIETIADGYSRADSLTSAALDNSSNNNNNSSSQSGAGSAGANNNSSSTSGLGGGVAGGSSNSTGESGFGGASTGSGQQRANGCPCERSLSSVAALTGPLSSHRDDEDNGHSSATLFAVSQLVGVAAKAVASSSSERLARSSLPSPSLASSRAESTRSCPSRKCADSNVRYDRNDESGPNKQQRWRQDASAMPFAIASPSGRHRQIKVARPSSCQQLGPTMASVATTNNYSNPVVISATRISCASLARSLVALKSTDLFESSATAQKKKERASVRLQARGRLLRKKLACGLATRLANSSHRFRMSQQKQSQQHQQHRKQLSPHACRQQTGKAASCTDGCPHECAAKSNCYLSVAERRLQQLENENENDDDYVNDDYNSKGVALATASTASRNVGYLSPQRPPYCHRRRRNSDEPNFRFSRAIDRRPIIELSGGGGGGGSLERHHLGQIMDQQCNVMCARRELFRCNSNDNVAVRCACSKRTHWWNKQADSTTTTAIKSSTLDKAGPEVERSRPTDRICSLLVDEEDSDDDVNACATHIKTLVQNRKTPPPPTTTTKTLSSTKSARQWRRKLPCAAQLSSMGIRVGVRGRSRRKAIASSDNNEHYDEATKDCRRSLKLAKIGGDRPIELNRRVVEDPIWNAIETPEPVKTESPAAIGSPIEYGAIGNATKETIEMKTTRKAEPSLRGKRAVDLSADVGDLVELIKMIVLALMRHRVAHQQQQQQQPDIASQLSSRMSIGANGCQLRADDVIQVAASMASLPTEMLRMTTTTTTTMTMTKTKTAQTSSPTMPKTKVDRIKRTTWSRDIACGAGDGRAS